MRPTLKLATLAIFGLMTLGGCVVRPAVVVGPGYYYDDAYYDVYGVYHPRAYWYYDGYHWGYRGWVGHGYYARPRGYYYRR
jgi:hypothetical protein